jgi:hypothetical protein
VAVAAIIPLPDLGRRPAQLQQEGGLAEAGAGGTVEGGLVEEGQRGQAAQQRAVGQAGALALDVQVGDGRQDAEFLVQGQQLVQGPAGQGGGQVGPLDAAEGVQDPLPVVTIPNPFHRRTSLGALILRLQNGRWTLSPNVCLGAARLANEPIFQ